MAQARALSCTSDFGYPEPCKRFTNFASTTAVDACLANNISRDLSVVLVFFFQSQTDTALSLFESVTKQLITALIDGGTPCSFEILSTLEKAYGENSRLQLSQVITDLVLPLCSLFQDVTLIIDGIDECMQSELRLIWKWLDKLLDEVSPRVLISSEDQTGLHFDGFDRIRVDWEHNKADIEAYIDVQIAGHSGPGQIFGDEALRTDVKVELQKKADGMFVSTQSRESECH